MNGRNKQTERDRRTKQATREKMGERDRGTHSLTLSALSEGGTVRCELETLARGLSVSETADTCSKCHKGGQICTGAVLRSALFQTLEVSLLLGTLRDDSGYDVCVCVCVCVCQPTDSRTADGQVKRHSQPVGTFSPHFISCLCPPYPSIDL